MTIQATKVYPRGLAALNTEGRTIVVDHAVLGETYGGVLEGAPTPRLDAHLRASFCASIRELSGSRAIHVVEPETVEVAVPGRTIRRMPAITCAAWLNSTPVRGAGAASEVVLIFWTEAADRPIGQLVERALEGVGWEQVAEDFDH